MALVFNPFSGTFDNVSDPATTTIKGIIQLAGDLAGTAALPRLAAIGVGATVGSATQIPVITYDTKGRVTNITTATPSAPTQRTFAYWAG